MQIKKHPWYRKRGYIHFDSPVSFKTAHKVVTNPKCIAKHAFYPLISYEIESIKFQEREDGTRAKVPKTRPIAYASHLDSHIYAYYANKLAVLYEERLKQLDLTKNVLAFRSLGKSNVQFANQAFEEIKRRSYCSVVALDVSGFFDNLDHSVLKKAWCNLLDEAKLPADHFNLFKSLTKFSKVDKTALYETLGISFHNPKNGRYKVCEVSDFRLKVRKAGLVATNKKTKGIPQGSPISALLSNIYMLEFDARASTVMDEQGGIYFRYCDDMLFITTKEFRDGIETFANNEIKSLGLEINSKKTEKRDFWIDNGLQTSNKPLQYLGFTYDGQRKLIRSASLARFSNRMKRGVRLAKKTRLKRNAIKVRQGHKPTKLYKRKLYDRYSHLGVRNFVTYGYRAANEMSSDAIRKQLKPLWKRLQEEIDK